MTRTSRIFAVAFVFVSAHTLPAQILTSVVVLRIDAAAGPMRRR